MRRPREADPRDAPRAGAPADGGTTGAGPGWRDLTTTGELRRLRDEADGLRPAIPDDEPIRAGRMAGMGATVGRWRTGARTELRRQLREVQRLRRITLVAVVLVVLGAYPGYLLTQVATRDPVLNSLDALDVPSWAAGEPNDVVFGSRWCIRECRFRERSLLSQRDPGETAQAYERALQQAGWQRWQVAGCPTDLSGYTCWTRDEFTLDLYVREPPCANDPLRNRPTVGPAGAPSASPSEAVSAGPPEDDCQGAAVTIKVRNFIDDPRGNVGPGDVLPSDETTVDPSSPSGSPTAAPGASGSPG